MVTRNFIRKLFLFSLLTGGLFLIVDAYFSNLHGTNNSATALVEADSLFNTKDYRSALRLYQSVLNDSLNTTHNRAEHEIYDQIGRIYFNLKELSLAAEAFKDGLRAAEQTDDVSSKARLLTNLATVFMMQKQPDQALEHCTQVLQLGENNGTDDYRGETFLKIGKIHYQTGAYHLALQYFKEARKLFEQKDQDESMASTLGYLGNVNLLLSNYPEALEFYKMSLELSREGNHPTKEALDLGNIGLVYFRLADFDMALQYYEASLVIHRELENHWGESSMFRKMAGVHRLQEDFTQALGLCEQSLKIQREFKIKTGTFELLCEMGEIHLSISNFEKAEECFNQAFDNSCELKDDSRQAWAFFCLGKLQAHRQNFDLAIDQTQKAIEITERLDLSSDFLSQYYSALGSYFESNGQDSLAFEYYLEGIGIEEEVRDNLEIEVHKRTFAERTMASYTNIVLTSIRLNRPTEAFNFAERSKARAFLDLLASGKTRISNSTIEISAVADSVPVVASNERPPATPIAIGSDQNSSKTIRSARSLIKTKTRAEPELVSLESVAPLRLEEIQSYLDDQTMLVEYFLTSESILCWLVTRDTCQIVQISEPLEKIEGMILGFRETIKMGGSTKSLSRKLYQMLIEPIEQHFSFQNLIIVPHRVLHHLPFQALQNKQSEFLMDRYFVRYLPSASILKYLKAKPSERDQRLLAFGNPTSLKENYEVLKYAEQEVKDLDRLFSESKILTGNAATETEFKAAAPNYDIVHLACHSELNPAYPLFSGLLLAPDEQNDGELDVFEIFTLDLNADLIVLSGCETGLGTMTTGDEIVGLSRAFLSAGTPSLVASLWHVEDESTGFLMAQFYSFLQDHPKAEALRLAQIETRKKYPEIFHWAPFILVGSN